MAHIRQLRPDSGVGSQVQVLKLFPLRLKAATEDCHTKNVFKVVLQKSTPPQIRQLILYKYYIKNTLTDL